MNCCAARPTAERGRAQPKRVLPDAVDAVEEGIPVLGELPEPSMVRRLRQAAPLLEVRAVRLAR